MSFVQRKGNFHSLKNTFLTNFMLAWRYVIISTSLLRTRFFLEHLPEWVCCWQTPSRRTCPSWCPSPPCRSSRRPHAVEVDGEGAIGRSHGHILSAVKNHLSQLCFTHFEENKNDEVCKPFLLKLKGSDSKALQFEYSLNWNNKEDFWC